MENLCFARMNKNGIRIQFSQFKTAANRAVLVLVRLARQNAKSEDVTNSILLSFLKVLFSSIFRSIVRPFSFSKAFIRSLIGIALASPKTMCIHSTATARVA